MLFATDSTLNEFHTTRAVDNCKDAEDIYIACVLLKARREVFIKVTNGRVTDEFQGRQVILMSQSIPSCEEFDCVLPQRDEQTCLLTKLYRHLLQCVGDIRGRGAKNQIYRLSEFAGAGIKGKAPPPPPSPPLWGKCHIKRSGALFGKFDLNS